MLLFHPVRVFLLIFENYLCAFIPYCEIIRYSKVHTNFFEITGWGNKWNALNFYVLIITGLWKIIWENTFSNFSCMFLNPNNFFQFIRSEKPPGTS